MAGPARRVARINRRRRSQASPLSTGRSQPALMYGFAGGHPDRRSRRGRSRGRRQFAHLASTVRRIDLDPGPLEKRALTRAEAVMINLSVFKSIGLPQIPVQNRVFHVPVAGKRRCRPARARTQASEGRIRGRQRSPFPLRNRHFDSRRVPRGFRGLLYRPGGRLCVGDRSGFPGILKCREQSDCSRTDHCRVIERTARHFGFVEQASKPKLPAPLFLQNKRNWGSPKT